MTQAKKPKPGKCQNIRGNEGNDLVELTRIELATS
jgi:hypothetical protein